MEEWYDFWEMEFSGNVNAFPRLSHLLVPNLPRTTEYKSSPLRRYTPKVLFGATIAIKLLETMSKEHISLLSRIQ